MLQGSIVSAAELRCRLHPLSGIDVGMAAAGMAAATDGLGFLKPPAVRLRCIRPSEILPFYRPSEPRCESRKTSRASIASLGVDWTEAPHSSGGTAADAADAPSSVPQVPQ